jgi:hypothetical protein
MDIVAAAYDNTINGRNIAGTVYVMFGSVNFGASGAVDLSVFQSGSEGFRIIGAAAGDEFGETVAGGGDINGDGYDDVLASSPWHDSGRRPGAGAVWVIFGRAKGSTFTDIDLAVSLPVELGIKIHGADTNNWLNYCAFVGDMNGDGFDEIMVAAPGYNGLDSHTGRAYVVFGQGSIPSFDVDDIDNVNGVPNAFLISGGLANTRLGEHVGTPGDFNGDGYSDALVISYGKDYIMVIFGHSDALDFPDFEGGPTFSQTTLSRSGYGFSIAGRLEQQSLPGDLNQDGIDDLVLYRPSGSPGVAWVIFGHRDGPFPDLDMNTFVFNTNTGFRITRAMGGDGCVATIGGDVNGDGITDLYVTSLYAHSDPSRPNAGIGYVLFSHSNATDYEDVDLATFTASATAGYRILGANPYDAGDTGWSWLSGASLGDVNGDGRDDVAWAAPGFDYNGRTNCGSVYILLNSSSSPVPAQPTSQPSSQPTSVPEPPIVPSYPTYGHRNGFAFAAVSTAGRAYTWGEGQYGGDSAAVQGSLLSDVINVVATRFAFAAVKSNGSVVPWGAQMNSESLGRICEHPLRGRHSHRQRGCLRGDRCSDGPRGCLRLEAHRRQRAGRPLLQRQLRAAVGRRAQHHRHRWRLRCSQA